MPVCAVSIKSMLPEIEAPDANTCPAPILPISIYGLPWGAAHSVLPEIPYSEALVDKLSTTSEIGPGIEDPLVFVMDPISAKKQSCSFHLKS